MRGALVGAVLALTFALTWALAKVPTLEDQASKSAEQVGRLDEQVATLNSRVDANEKALAEANSRLVAKGEAPVPVPKVEPSSPPQPDEFTETEAAAVREIVADQIARTPAKVTQAEITQIARVAAALIPKPKDGKTPTAAELKPAVSAALDAFCAQDRCVGKPGTDGKPGEPGEPAPEVTDEQLLASAQQALVIYCAAETKPCEGKPGAAGKDGEKGAPGRGIADTDCLPDGTWKIYYTDGTTDITNGPCRIPVPPN